MHAINTGISRLLASALLMLYLTGGALAQELVTLTPVDPPQQLAGITYKDKQAMHPLEAKGPLTAVHLWATWCVPCVSELPEVDAVQRAYEGKGLKIVAISLDTTMDKVTQFYADHNITALPAFLDHHNASFKASGARGLPVTLFLNETGDVIARADGPLNWNGGAVKQFLEMHLKAAP